MGVIFRALVISLIFIVIEGFEPGLPLSSQISSHKSESPIIWKLAKNKNQLKYLSYVQ